MQNKHKHKTDNHLVPVVNYDNYVLSITTPHKMIMAHVIIRNQDNKIVYASSILLAPTENCIQLPASYDDDIYTIDIVCGEDHFVGSFLVNDAIGNL
jgi:hypothetical protein